MQGTHCRGQCPKIVRSLKRGLNVVMKRFTLVMVMVILISGCGAVPVKETAVPQPAGGFATCTQRGMGVISYWVGKIKYDQCVKDADGMGGDVARLAGLPLDTVIGKLGYPKGEAQQV